jgi:hypothetical protein
VSRWLNSFQHGDTDELVPPRRVSFVLLRVRAAVRHRWRALVVLAVVVGIGGGTAIAALAGAQRTDTAVPRFVAYSQPDDGGFLFGNPSSPPVTPGIPQTSLAMATPEQRVVQLPQVAAYFRAPYLFVTTARNGSHSGVLNVIGDANADLYRTVDRPMVVAGRLPDPRHPFEVAVNELAARREHLQVGSSLRLYTYSYAQVENQTLITSAAAPPPPEGPSFRVHVSGIVRSPQDVNAVLPLVDRQGVTYESQRNLYTTPAFLQQLAKGLGVSVQQIPDIDLVAVRLHHGSADWKAFAQAAKKVSGADMTLVAPGNVYDINSAAASAQHGIHLDVVALIVFGLLVALITLLFAGQSIGRQVRNQRGDFAVLQSLGADRPMLVATEVAVSGLVGVASAAIAVVVAVAASPLMPVGLARQAEIHPGVSADPVYLVPGFFVLAVLIALAALVPALRASRRAVAADDEKQSTASASALSRWLSRGLSPVPAIGVRFGLDTSSGVAASTAGGLMIAAVAVATVAASLTFASSLNHLVASPQEQGWNWNVLVGNPNDTTDQEQQMATQLAHDRDVSGYSAIAIIAGASQGTAVIGGHVIPLVIALDPFKGSVHPTLVAGHAPRAPDQIVLAAKTMDVLHRSIGQSVQIPTPGGRLSMHIVGEMISPSVGDLFTNGLGEGAWIYGPAVHHMLGAHPEAPNVPPTVFDLFVVRFAPGVAPSAGLAGLQNRFGHDVLQHVPPEDVINLQSVSALPALLAGLVVLLGIATVGNALVVSVRRRRHDLAVFKTIGFVRRQIAGVVAWQASSMGLVALIVGIPVGIAAGRWVWTAVATGVGTSSPAVVPALAVALLVPAVLIAVNLLAGAPGWSAARVAPAQAMRAE